MDRWRNHLLEDKPDVINPEHYIRQSLLIVRYLLFSLTTVFYLASPPFSPIFVKIMVVLSFLAATILAQSLYDNLHLEKLQQNNTQKTKTLNATNPDIFNKNMVALKLIVIETICIGFLILPTGGVDSHFVWYALNPIIAGAVYLPWLFCWGILGLFVCTALIASSIYPGLPASPIYFLSSHMSLLLVFLITTSLTQVAVSLCRRLGMAYTWLAIAHEATERSLKHVSGLYQALEAFSTREDSAQLVDVLAVYSSKLCHAPAVCYLKSIDCEGQDDGGAILRIANEDGLEIGIDWEKEIHQMWNQIKPVEGLVIESRQKEAGQLIAVPVISHGECFGLLGYLQLSGADQNYEEREKTLIFLAGVAGIILERLKTDKLWERLLVSEEQNRIANEIHDGVSQYLFSIVCALDSLAHEQANLQDKRIQEQLRLVEETANLAAKELRASIYKLSPHKRGESIFVDNLASYLDDLGRLNGIRVDLQAEGSEEVLSPALRKALYRIVREASSNAVRHGKCSYLRVYLSMLPNQTVLEIEDNGCGYKAIAPNALGGRKTGLGHWNMYQLATCFNGDLVIQSEPGRGTLVRFSIPKKMEIGDGLKEVVTK
ncbi:MAG: hypothetical protein GX755_08425 [Syntrophomonadaceae bacterium]|nr:hypothetical protein [Syntrophomonadaceae bacterium]